MRHTQINWIVVEKLLEELVEEQQKKLLCLGRKIIPTLTSEDVLQPNDYPELENDPLFRYEEGLLTGIQGTQIAIKALKKELEYNPG